MGFKKFFEKLTGMEEPKKESLEGLKKEEIDKAIDEAKPEITPEMKKAPNEPIEEPLEKPLSEKEMGEVLKPLEEAQHGTKEDKDFAA